MSSKVLKMDNDTSESMHEIFEEGLNGPTTEKFLMNARNWCTLTFEHGCLICDLRMERVQGDMNGHTKSYLLRIPAIA